MEFLHAGFVRRDGGAFDAHAVALDGMRRVDRHLVGGLVAVLDAEVVIVELDVEIWQDQLLLDEVPDDAGHLVAVEFDDRVLNLDLVHGILWRWMKRARYSGGGPARQRQVSPRRHGGHGEQMYYREA